MSSTPPRITIVAPTGAECAELSSQIAGLPGAEIHTRPGDLCRMNGTAISLMREPGIVLTRITDPNEADLEAIEGIAGSAERAARMIVLSDADMPLSVARRLLRAGVSEVLPVSSDGRDLRNALQFLTRDSQLPTIWTGKSPGRILSVTRARGGIGATTLAVNLADALARPAGGFRKAAGHSVALVDLDLQFGAVASFLDLPAGDTLYDMAVHQRVPDQARLDDEMARAANGVRVLTAPDRFVPLDGLAAAQVATLLEALRERFDYVIVDLPHGLVDWVQAAIDRSDRVFLVTDSTVPAIRQSKRLIDFFQEESPGIPLEVVINHETKPMIRARHHTQAAKLLGRTFQTWLPSDPKVARAALDRGVPLSVAGRRSPLARSIAQFARTVQRDLGAAAASSVHSH